MLLFAAVAAVACSQQQGWETAEAVVAPGERLSLAENYVRAYTDLVADITGDFKGVSIERGGLGVYQGAVLKITGDSVFVSEYCWYEETEVTQVIAREAFAHGLSLGDKVKVSLTTEKHNIIGHLDIRSGRDHLSRDIFWRGGGIPAIVNEGDSPLSVRLSFRRRDASQPIWFLADSYFSEYDPERWPYYMVSEGFAEGWMADHLPGGGSAQFLRCFKEDLKYGTPKIAVWMLGMNDPDRDGMLNEDWYSSTEEFLQICSDKGIIPVLVTVPDVPARCHSIKTEWVRNSGVRYADWAAAVEGMDWLSGDEVHPSEDGAKILWETLRNALPELKR